MDRRKDAPEAGELWNRAATALWVLDCEGCVADANPAAEALAGRTRPMLAGERFSLFLEETPRILGHLATADESQVRGPAPQFALFGSFASGAAGNRTERPVRAVFSRLSESPERAYLVEVTDLSDHFREERRRLEAEVAEANRELLRNLAHEVKNPLGGIRGAAQLLDADLTHSEDRECTQIILEEADRLTHLVDRLLQPYRTAATDESVNVHETFEHVRGLMEREFPCVPFVRDYDISLPSVLFDGGRLTQVLLNLARNAAEALESGAWAPPEGEAQRVTFRTRLVRDVFLRDVRTRRAAALEVTDNGPGIPDPIRDRIFFPLVTGRAEGSGLGLPLVKSYVEAAGGAVSVESRPGHTVFRLLLPLADDRRKE